MTRFLSATALLGALVTLTSCTLFDRGLTPYALRTEARAGPIGIGDSRPRLSWKVASEQRAQTQTAYRVLVASRPWLLQVGQADLWDSGKVESDETTGVVYEGTPLRSGQRPFWTVGVWSGAAETARWAEPASWTMGILDPAEWQAQWIGFDAPAARESELELDFGKAKWIWLSGEPAMTAPKGKRYFRAGLDLPEGVPISRANILVTADNRFSLWVNGEPAGPNDPTRGSWNVAGELEIASALRGGANVLALEVENGGVDPAGVIARVEVVLSEGDPVVLETTSADWKVKAEPGAGWMSLEYDDAAWQPAQEVCEFGGGPWQDVKLNDVFLPPARYLRTEFRLRAAVARALVHTTALGLCDIRINGEAVSGDYFNPGWTDYDQRIYYRTYDVTDLLRTGENALGATLADGWYAGYVGFGHKRAHYGTKIRLLTQVEVEYTDGTRQTFGTGPEWKATTGPLLEADFLMGEVYDARLEMPGWDESGFDDSAWSGVDVSVEKPGAVIEAHPGPPIVEIAEIRPVSITEPTPGAYVLDMGQNFAGVLRIRVKGEAGQKIILRHGERLNEDGTLYTTNLRSARATDTYICRGTGQVEVWQPRFTFHGFQYAEVTGWPGKPTADDIVGLPLSSDTPIVGTFECSDPMVNQLFSNIYWTQRMNFIDIPTDCPQRDERLGWTGDAQVYIHTSCLITDNQAFFDKWLLDLTDAQREDGQFPMVAPLKSGGVSADGGPAWADAGVVCPWETYWMYGDRRVLERQYDSMARFISFVENRCTPELLPPAQFHCFGDWLSIKADTPKDVIFLAYFGYSTSLMARAAEALGRTDDAKRYRALFERIKASFNRAYVESDGKIKGHTQAVYVMAIAFDLVEGERFRQAAEWLVADIEGRGNHLSTGFIGTKDLMLALSKIGREDVAYRLLHNTTFPSWGFSIQHGATSIWERWNGWTPTEGFGDAGMNSFAHYSFGAVYQWICSTVGGIDSDAPGFETIVIRPRPGGKLTWAKATYDSVRGPIRTSWKLEDGTISLAVTIPANTTATVYVPTDAPEAITESGTPAAEATGVRAVTAGVFEVGSGTYSFRAPFGGRAETENVEEAAKADDEDA